MADAVWKFISRFLTGKRLEMDINGEVNLFLFLTKMELWIQNFKDDNKFEIEFGAIQDKLNAKIEIKAKQAVKLYRILIPDAKLKE